MGIRKIVLLFAAVFAATNRVHGEQDSNHHHQQQVHHHPEVVVVEELNEKDVVSLPNVDVDVTKQIANEDTINLLRPDHGKEFYQGDIILTPDQIETLKKSPSTNKRAVVIDSSYLWPDAVLPYVFSSSVPSSYRSVILGAMNEISRQSCVRFVPRSSETHYVRFIRDSGCYSYVGRLRRGSQDISIGRGCQTEGIVMHELFHALGRWHEQSRPDRDRYIEIHEENILRGYESQFQLVSLSDATTNDINYDYYSIMHYGAYAFSKNYGKDATITPKDSRINTNALGQRQSLSFKDIEHIKQLYCSESTITEESEWSSWTSWSQCSTSCGRGLQSRSRACLPAGGASCPGNNRETRVCDSYSPNCPGRWTTWTSWSSCTPSCGDTRRRTRTRSCQGLGQCSGQSTQTGSCPDTVCPENMGEWSPWSRCPEHTCRRIYTIRIKRNCRGSCSKPRYELKMCSLASNCASRSRDSLNLEDNQLSDNLDIIGMNSTDMDITSTNGCPRSYQPMHMLSFLSILCLNYLIKLMM